VLGLFRRHRAVPDAHEAASRRRGASTPAVPEGHRVYAVGDIHGRSDLLDRLLGLVTTDIQADTPTQAHLVLLGDYIDRGLDSRGVLDRLSQPAEGPYGTICLKGNHEDSLLRFLDDVSVGHGWLRYGGLATLVSYGIARPDRMDEATFLDHAQEQLRRHLPPRHLAFLHRLKLQVRVGDYQFVHAGVRPGVPLDRQDPDDLIWIRDEFLHSDADYGAVVVHGHSITDEPHIRHNRIGIDTGAFATGRLTCLVLEGETRRFLTT
jgi:serine/threonine protein phosphatase 1